MLMPSGQSVPFHAGHAFFHLTDSSATELVDTAIATAEGKIKALDTTIAATREKLTEYKAILYAKFGKNQINLDE